jgi:ATP-binding cassette subfamily B protein
VAIGRIDEILQTQREQAPAKVAPLPASKLGEVVFDDVSFAHRETPVLQHISFTIPAGSTLALLGPSGSGKSTIAHLLMRFYDPASGSIRIDGMDIVALDQKTVRSQIAVVMQEPFLFSRSIRENIRFARPAAVDDEIVEAATMAAVHESIAQFEKQYDTVVGERGITLSGGQRQRVAIARALLHDAPILILDDALSAVDTETESQILDALRHRHSRRTTILIAHRLSTVMHADQILVLEHGRIVQRGDHQSLVNSEGLYRKLWQIQTALEDDLRATQSESNEEFQPVSK